MKREEIINELKMAKKILVTISDFGYSRLFGGRFPYFKIYIEDKEGNIYPIIDRSNPYWNKRKEAYGLNCYGTDRVFEIIYSLCRDDKLTNEVYRKVHKLW